MSEFDESLLDYIHATILVLPLKHKQFAEIAQRIYKRSMKSVIENDKFIIYKRMDDKWVRYAHKDLALNEIRKDLCSYLDKARYMLKPPVYDWNYPQKMKQWQDSILKLLRLHEQLQDYTFMKCILKEFMLLIYEAS